ncbi:MAG: carboxypeptidase regulatory-like domain-containing protein [Pseudomonadota bacterium]|nr:carboxypeptidase regulatory-like domain-containing protein [Pseudomonadota bacterium]
MTSIRSKNHRPKALALAITIALSFTGGVQAQSTTGSIYGVASEGATVTVRNDSGLSRTVTADASGRYNIGTLPVGNYKVVVEQDGTVIGASVVTVRAGAGADASAAGAGDPAMLETVTVTASNVPGIDITAVDARSVITADQLERLPLGRTSEAIALLAPGAVSGAAGYGDFRGLVSFGGAGVSENAYYVNGYFTGEPLSNMGGFDLPYGAIEQQETFIGGYSAKYGRSDGGVINQIGKRGNNEWHFGGQAVFTPKSLRGDMADRYFPELDLSEANANPNLPSTCGADTNGDGVGDQPCQYTYSDDTLPGTLYSRGEESTRWGTSYNVHGGGPIIKDRLFAFASAEWNGTKQIQAPNALEGAPVRSEHTKTENPKLYARLDWNISDNHFLEVTYLGEETEENGVFYNYDFEEGTTGSRYTDSVPDPFYQKNEFFIGKYTGYLSDNLTLSVTAGQGKLVKQQTNPSIVPGLAFISNAHLQNPAFNGGTPRSNSQGGLVGIDAKDTTKGLRADLEWLVGDHALTFGIDNITFEAENEGEDQIVDRWIYGRTTGNVVPGIIGSPVSGANPEGYYTYKYIYDTATSMTLDQKAWYIEDRWQVSDNLLLSLGVRNDAFVNRNNFGQKYLDAKDQWAPRLGFAWDVNGDASLKVFGNAGRYFLAMPNNVAVRGGSASTYTREYFTYTGIDANGVPTGLQHVGRLDGEPNGPYSTNDEYGEAVDTLAFAPSDLKNMYQDEYILGMERMLGEHWMFGAKLTLRDLGSAVDDICDPDTMEEVLEDRGIDTDSVKIPGCLMFNPGGTNTFSLANIDPVTGKPTGSRTEVTMSSDDWGFTDGMSRKYSGLDLYLERPFDGKWEARVDYTYSKSKGNMEGQVKSDYGQVNISKTVDWDAAAVMQFARGYLPNDRRHQLKARGSYQITEELLVGGNVRVQSGAPIACIGYFNPGDIDENSPEGDPLGYDAVYHTCFGEVASPGKVRTPWTKTLDVGLTYRPKALDDKLTLGMQVLNVFNSTETLQVNVTSEDAPYTVSNTYMLPIGRLDPRTVVFTAAYDW